MLVGLPSPGLRSNGYSLARRALLERGGPIPRWAGLGRGRLMDAGRRAAAPFGDLHPGGPVAAADAVEVHAVAHITGGGLPGNVPRVLADDLDAVLERGRWPVPRIFAEIQEAGGVDDEEMARVFNLGLGMVVAVLPRRELT